MRGILHCHLVSAHSHSAVLGFPRIGPNREVKKALESYWGQKSSAEELLKVAKEQRLATYEFIKGQGVDFIPTGTFSLYDHVLDTSNTFNAIPDAYAKADVSALDRYFAMARGHQVSCTLNSKMNRASCD